MPETIEEIEAEIRRLSTKRRSEQDPDRYMQLCEEINVLTVKFLSHV